MLVEGECQILHLACAFLSRPNHKKAMTATICQNWSYDRCCTCFFHFPCLSQCSSLGDSLGSEMMSDGLSKWAERSGSWAGHIRSPCYRCKDCNARRLLASLLMQLYPFNESPLEWERSKTYSIEQPIRSGSTEGESSM